MRVFFKGDLRGFHSIVSMRLPLKGSNKVLGPPKPLHPSDPSSPGISCLAYAIGANRTQVVKKLLENKDRTV